MSYLIRICLTGICTGTVQNKRTCTTLQLSTEPEEKVYLMYWGKRLGPNAMRLHRDLSKLMLHVVCEQSVCMACV